MPGAATFCTDCCDAFSKGAAFALAAIANELGIESPGAGEWTEGDT